MILGARASNIANHEAARTEMDKGEIKIPTLAAECAARMGHPANSWWYEESGLSRCVHQPQKEIEIVGAFLRVS